MTVYQVTRYCSYRRDSCVHHSPLFSNRAAAEAFLAAATTVDLWRNEEDWWQSCSELGIEEHEALDEFTGLPEV